jgi:signal transduction histidine kinase
LFVIQGADQGKRFELASTPVALGRDNSNPIRLHDTEVSRRHAEVRLVNQTYRILDLGSANGTFVNGQAVDQSPLRSGDRLQLGQSVMLFNEGPASGDRELTDRVNMLSPTATEDRSAILRSVPAGEGSRVLEAPDLAGGWLKDRLANLTVIYRATQAISHVLDTDALLPEILELVFESIGADRGAVLLKDESGKLLPKAVRWRSQSDPNERLTISRSIVDHVLEKGQGVITSDAPGDKRFGPAQSIVDYGIREAICVPLQGRHVTLGVLYADIQSAGALVYNKDGTVVPGKRGRFSQDHLMLMVAIGHQAGLAIENTEFYKAKVQAERLAAVGQTIATLSHHIKNILQGIRGGSYLIDMGLKDQDEAIVRRGWTIVEKNQGKIYNLVMDMLSFSKEREPALELSDLNEMVADVVELMTSRAQELSVALEWTPAKDLPQVMIDPDGIHRAVLNIVTNAIDAAEGKDGARVVVTTGWEAQGSIARVSVTDNGVGIEESEIDSIFQVFASTKGSRGTGLGLPVSQKIVREHGGRIAVTSRVGQGSTFVIELPMRRGDVKAPGTGEMGTLGE